MRRVMLTGSAVALGDGVLLGTTLAQGWTIVAALCAVAGVVGAVWVATATPAPRAPARPSTVTLGLPVREIAAPEVPEPGSAAQDVEVFGEREAAPVAA